MSKRKYSLVGVDGNAYSVMGYVSNALKEEGLGNIVQQYVKEATSSDYNNLLCVSMDYLNKANASKK